MEQEIKRIKSQKQRDEPHIYWNDDTWEFPDVREPEIKLHPLGFYNKQFHELNHILDDSSLWGGDKKIKTSKQNIILNAFSELQDKASLLESPHAFGNKFSDFIEKNGYKMFINLNKLLGYHVAKTKGEDQSEFLKNHKLVLSSYKTDLLEHEGTFRVNVGVATSSRKHLRNVKLWKEYVWTVAKMPTLTKDVQGLINLPGAEWYGLLFDAKLIQRVMDKKNNFAKEVKGMKYQIDIDNPPSLKKISPHDFTPSDMQSCCKVDKDTVLFVFMYLLFPEVGKYVDMKNRYNQPVEFNLEALSYALNADYRDDVLDLNRENVLKLFNDRYNEWGYRRMHNSEKYSNSFGGLFEFMKKEGYFMGPSSSILLSQVLKKKGLAKDAALDYTDKFSDEYQTLYLILKQNSDS